MTSRLRKERKIDLAAEPLVVAFHQRLFDFEAGVLVHESVHAAFPRPRLVDHGPLLGVL
jgi:hypothetical protein